jgi:type IV secretory pathway VirD2 relaxase
VSDERPFRLRPRRPQPGRDEAKVWARGFQQLMRLARMTAKPLAARLGGSSTGQRSFPPPARHNQRCAVRLTYAGKKMRGQWAAHGRYLVRDSATALRRDGSKAFGSLQEPIDIPRTLAAWQRSGDERLFKLVLSPEFGERLDLERLTREVMAAVGQDTGAPLEWAAVVHRNTDHPHVHVVLRGSAAGRPVRFDRQHVQHGIRCHAESACTLQLGYRTSLDREEAEWREVSQARFTSLDRVLARAKVPDAKPGSQFEVSLRPDAPELSGSGRAREQRLVARLNYLTDAGLAQLTAPLTWSVDADFERTLRAFQRAQDRQRMMAQHAAFLSDPRLQFRVVSSNPGTDIVGRVIAHVLDEISDRPHVLIEGIDGVVYYVPDDAGIAEARANGGLRPNAFVQLQRAGSPLWTARDFGDADCLLTNRGSFKAALTLAQPTVACDQHWSGWLGRYWATRNWETMMASMATGIQSSHLQRRSSRVR